MNIPLHGEYEAIIRWWISTGKFDTPESVVEAALRHMKPVNNMKPVNTRDLPERVPDPPLAVEESIFIPAFPHEPGVLITPTPATEERLPQILFDAEME